MTTAVDAGLTRSGYETQLRQWVEGTGSPADFELSALTEGSSEGVRAVDTALRNVLWDVLEAYGHRQQKPPGGSTEPPCAEGQGQAEAETDVEAAEVATTAGPPQDDADNGDNKNGRCQTRSRSSSALFSSRETQLLSRLIDVMVTLCEKDMASPNLPATIFTDLFDTLTISRCERLFHLVESRVELWKRPAFFGACKNQLLRMCNDLLRRLSKSQNTVFCGQILIVLAKLFPLSERSGLNIVSEFNTEHLPIRSEQVAATPATGSGPAAAGDAGDDADELPPVSSANQDAAMEVVGGAGEKPAVTAAGQPGTADSTAAKVNLNLYRKFWSLQEFFRQPNLCYNANHWRQMTKCSQEVLTVFQSFRLDEHAAAGKPTETYFAKYLTSRKLFELELSDSNFRRCILIQFLIMFHYLKANVRFKLESQTLSEEQSQWVREKSAEIYKLLEETPPDGKEFAKSIAAMMAREEMWNAWKNDNCPAFRVADAPERKLVRRRRPIGDDIREHLAKGQVSMGNPELTRLFNICPDSWEACRGERRNYVPSMEQFFEEAITQADPAACIEDQYKLTHNPNWGWRALRILSQKSLHFFTSTNQPAKSLPNYLDTMVGYLAKDISITKEGSKEGTNGTSAGGKIEEVDENSQDDFKDDEADSGPSAAANLAPTRAQSTTTTSSTGAVASADSLRRRDTSSSAAAGGTGTVANVEDDDDDDVDNNNASQDRDTDGHTRPDLRSSSANNEDNKNGREDPPPKRSRLATRSAAAHSAGEVSHHVSSGGATLSTGTIGRLASVLGADCARLAPHMGLSDDELQYVQSQHEEDPVAQAKHLLTLWKENEPQDATLDKIKQIMAKLGLTNRLTDAGLKG